MLRVLFAGGEGTGKTSCIEALAASLGATHRVLVADPETPVLVEAGARRRLLRPGWGRAQRRARRAARRLRVYPVFLIGRFALRVLLSRWLEARWRPDVSLYDGDLLLHPVAYARYHFAPARRLPPRLALRVTARLLGAGGGAAVVHLVRPPSEAARRIASRSHAEAHVAPARDLERLADELERVSQAARELGHTVLRVEAQGRRPEDLAREIEPALRARL